MNLIAFPNQTGNNRLMADEKNPMEFFKGAENTRAVEPSASLHADIEKTRQNSEARRNTLDAMSEKNPVRIVGEHIHAALETRENRSLGKKLLNDPGRQDAEELKVRLASKRKRGRSM